MSKHVETIDASDPWREWQKEEHRANGLQELLEIERDKNHSARVALMAAEATLALCGSVNAKLPGYIEDRRAETYRIVKKALGEA